MISTLKPPEKSVYYDTMFKSNAVKIGPGEFYFTDQNLVIITVLGSCVSACLRDPIAGVGGMNHFMLPDGGDKDGVSESLRYGGYAMEMLINQLIKAGAKKERIEAKVFGGGNVTESLKSAKIGEKNVGFVKEFMRLEGIPIVQSDFNDIYPRKVCYFPKSGKVFMKKLQTLDERLAKQEKSYASTLVAKPVSGAVELF